MASLKFAYFFLSVLCWIAIAPLSVSAQATTLDQSVEQALGYSPQLRALTHSNAAIEHELKQYRARYRPSVDFQLGYGSGQHSDSVTRAPGASPSDTQWESRGDATLKLTQSVYDGGETRQHVSIQKALLETSDFGLREAVQAISLNAIRAHLEVYRQREFVVLAEKDLEVHQDIYRSLSEIEQAGVGDIADVTQTRTRIARARSILIIGKGDLDKANSNYERVVGVKPGQLVFAQVPDSMPNNLEEALTWMEQKNPGLLAFNARVMEADARVGLARSAYKPKFNIELSSRYHDRLEGDPSWQHTNDAMLVMHWNLFNGGQDKEAANAALSRKYESRSNRDNMLIELGEATAAAWATYLSLRSQKKVYRDAVTSSKETFDAYLKQYSVSRRSLLDVLNAEREYFQAARQLVSISVNEVIEAYRILRLSGVLQFSKPSNDSGLAPDLSRLAHGIILPSAAQSSRTRSKMVPARSTPDTDLRYPGAKDQLASAVGPETPSTPQAGRLYSMEIGPFLNNRVLDQAKKIIRRRGLTVRQTTGTGIVKVTRLLEGVYVFDEAFRRLEALKRTVDAFVMPKEGNLAIYVGSFLNHKLAIDQAHRLAEQNIEVSPVSAELEMQGRMLVVQQVDRQTAEMISAQMSMRGLTAKVSPLVEKH